MKAFWFVFIIIFSSHSVSCQKLTYELKALGINLGKAQVEKTVAGELATYRMESTTVLKLLFTDYKIHYVSTSIYQSGVLQKSHVVVNVNGKLKEETNITKNQKSYTVHRIEDGKTENWQLDLPQIFRSTSVMFFERAKPGDVSLAESYGTMCSVLSGSNENETIAYDEKSNTKTVYTYQGKYPIKRMVEYPVVNFFMTLVEDESYFTK